jgi:torulene dioxygenase
MMSGSAAAAAFENVSEERTPVDLEIHGQIPPWLSGILYRTGPGTTRIPTTADPSKSVAIQHWFDGLALHHRFEIFPGGQRVSYCSHSGSEDLQKGIADTGEYPPISFGQQGDPCQSIFRKFFAVFQTMRTLKATPSPSGVNVSVTLTPNMPGWDSETSNLPTLSSGPRYLVAKSDTASLQLLDPTTLKPLKVSTYKQIDPRLDGELSASHSCRDDATGDFYNYSCKVGGRFPTYKIFKIDGKDGKADVLAEIKDAPLSYIHSFAMTDRYLILTVWQAYVK